MKDDQLVFLISLPRSGSTMLQRILGSHEKIFTRSEPWIMLHQLSAFRVDSMFADYDQRLAVNATNDFLQDISKAGEVHRKYFSKIGAPFLELYSEYLKKSQKELFLDKTPRYHLIFDELQQAYPNAKFIILKRNPIAIFCSILDTWVDQDFDKLAKFGVDLDKGVDFLSRNFSDYKNCLTVRYEDLLENPKDIAGVLFDFLNVTIDLSCISYDNESSWKYGDQGTVYLKNTPDLGHADKWKDTIDKKGYSFLSLDYIERIGKQRFDLTGYDYEDAVKVIKSSGDHKRKSLRDVKPLNYLLMQSFEKELFDAEQRVSNAEVLLHQSQEALDISTDAQKELKSVGELLEQQIGKYKTSSDELKLKINTLELSFEGIRNRNSKLASSHVELSRTLKEMTNEAKNSSAEIAKLAKRDRKLSREVSELESALTMKKDETEKIRSLILEVQKISVLRNPIKKVNAYKKLINFD